MTESKPYSEIASILSKKDPILKKLIASVTKGIAKQTFGNCSAMESVSNLGK